MGRLIATAMAAALAFVGSTQGALASQGPLTLGGNLQVQLPDGFSLSTERVSPAHDGGVYYDYEFTATPTQALNALYAFDFFTPPEEAGVLVVLNVAFGPALEGDNVLTTNSPTGSFLVQDPLELPSCSQRFPATTSRLKSPFWITPRALHWCATAAPQTAKPCRIRAGSKCP